MWDKYLHFPQADTILALDCGGQFDAMENTWHLELNLDSKAGSIRLQVSGLGQVM